MNRNLKQNLNLLKASYNNAKNHIAQNLSFDLYCRPQKVYIFLTFRCHLRCEHCYLWETSCDELTTDKWKEVIAKLKKWLGSFFLVITGGEPLMRKDLFELINFSYKLGIVTILLTSGDLIDKYLADKIVESGLDTIYISLDGFKEKTHDFLRGEGVHKKVMNAIGYLKNRINLQINTTIMSDNLDEFLDLVDFCENNGLGISLQGLYWRVNNQTTYLNAQDNELWPKDIEKAEWVIDQLILRKKKSQNIRNSVRHLQLVKYSFRHPDYNMNYRCQVYKKNFSIMPDGTVGLCHEFGTIGNLALQLPKQIWNSKEAFLKRKQMKTCHINCSFLNARFHENLLEKNIHFKNIFLTYR